MQSRDISAFWARFQDGIEVAVASATADKLLGVRDGFLRYFHDGLDQPVSVAVAQKPTSARAPGLCLSDEESVDLARQRAREIRERLGDEFAFYIGTEGGLHWLEVAGEGHWFVRNWSVIVGPTGEAWGASGSVEIPDRLVSGLEHDKIPFAVPGRRRHGGMISSLTGGLETRRKAVAASTFHALSTALYGVLESRPVRRRL